MCIRDRTGTVIFREALIGEHVERSKVLFSVSDLRTLWAMLDAYEDDLPKISKDSRVDIRTEVYPGRSFSGRITYISDMIDEKLRTAKIRVEVENPEGILKPNMYIQGVFQNVDKGRPMLVIPEGAVQNLDGEKIVFLRQGKDEFIHRHVRLGERTESGRVILEGLQEGDLVVVKGAFSLKSELSKAGRGHDHVH